MKPAPMAIFNSSTEYNVTSDYRSQGQEKRLSDLINTNARGCSDGSLDHGRPEQVQGHNGR